MKSKIVSAGENKTHYLGTGAECAAWLEEQRRRRPGFASGLRMVAAQCPFDKDNARWGVMQRPRRATPQPGKRYKITERI